MIRRLAGVKQAVFREILPPALHESLRLYVRALRDGDCLTWEDWGKRWIRHDDPLFVLVHRTLTPLVSATVGREVKPSYVFLAVYGEGGAVPRHRDREQCRYTLDVCLEDEGGEAPWPLLIEGEPVHLRSNDAVLYFGIDQDHWREPKPAAKNSILAFFHFVDGEYAGTLD